MISMHNDYSVLIQYVKDMLQKYNDADHTRTTIIHYDRFEHTMRVYHWMQTLYDAYPHKNQLDYDSLAIATIFHDIGYCDIEHIKDHAKIGAQYCREYLQKNFSDTYNIDFICELIEQHSDKKNLYDIPMELVILREADLLDDTGAHGLVIDIWMEIISKENTSFEAILKHMEKYTLQLMRKNPMRTDKAREIWEEKRQLTEAFINSYRTDLQMGQ